jgi:hypothetical protein
VSDPEMLSWLRREIGQDRAMARDLTESEAAAPVWHEMTSGVLVTGPPEHDDAWSGTFAMGDSRLTRFIAGRDPRWVAADCEAKLAVLDEYAAAVTVFEVGRTEPGGIGPGVYACLKAFDRTVRLLGWAYQFRDGYKEIWRP